MSGYNLIFIEGNLQSLGEIIYSEQTKPINFWGELSKKEKPNFFLFNKIPSIISKYHTIFNENYPFKKLDIVSVPYEIKEISAPGLITIRYVDFVQSACCKIIIFFLGFE